MGYTGWLLLYLQSKGILVHLEPDAGPGPLPSAYQDTISDLTMLRSALDQCLKTPGRERRLLCIRIALASAKSAQVRELDAEDILDQCPALQDGA